MSDIHVDNLNNSQLILLVLLISLVVSAATAVATLSLVYRRLTAEQVAVGDTQPTVIQQTINRIIEREREVPVESGPAAIDEYANQGAAEVLTLEHVERAMAQLYFGSQRFAVGVFVSADGYILVPEVLDTQRRYSILDSVGDLLFYSLVYTDGTYSLLTPMEAYTTSHYVPLTAITTVSLGQPIVMFSGTGEDARLHSGIISQKKSDDGVLLIRTSIQSSDITDQSVVFIDNVFAGFVKPYAQWVTLVSPAVITQGIQADGQLTNSEDHSV